MLRNLEPSAGSHFLETVEVVDRIGQSDVAAILDLARACAARDPGPAEPFEAARVLRHLAGVARDDRLVDAEAKSVRHLAWRGRERDHVGTERVGDLHAHVAQSAQADHADFDVWVTILLAVDPAATILAYHERTKHHPHRYAAGPGSLDWASQPDPFRTYAGAPIVALPLEADSIDTPYDLLFEPGGVAPRAPSLASVAALFELALGLSAWKEYLGERWALRCDPSSGNLHPTEGYLVTGGLDGLEAGIYHYVSRDHCLERRCALDAASARQLGDSSLIGVTSIPWREAWKYGERALRYCQHDAGHVLASVRFAAATLGWSVRLLDGAGDAEISALLGLNRSDDYAGVDALDRETAEMLLLVTPRPERVEATASELSARLAALAAGAASCGTWTGRANRLSSSHADWEVIELASKAAERAAASCEPGPARSELPPPAPASRSPAATLIRQRRSAVAMDGVTRLSAATFYAMLDRLLARERVPPWDALPWAPAVHCGIFVHRVDGLPPGLYALERDLAVHERLRESCRPDFAWTRPAGCPPHLRLFGLVEADVREAARGVSCHQEIAADGAFSLGMLAEFGDGIRARGAWWWRRLFWEAGVLGHTLYLEAEAAGIRATGIGCYFDDAFHDLLGSRGDRFQSLYHFTVGGPVDDARLRTLAPYAHLPRARP